MFYVMESKTDVIVSDEQNININQAAGFKIVAVRKTLRGAEKLAEKRCA